MKGTSNKLEYKVDLNAIIANFVCFWKSQLMSSFSDKLDPLLLM